MEKYQDRPMDLADATLVLAAEKTGFHQILTLDQDFYFYRINGESSFGVAELRYDEPESARCPKGGGFATSRTITKMVFRRNWNFQKFQIMNY